jgi:hypothetical protein
MTATLLADVQNQVQTFWSNLFMDELKERTLLPALVNKDYQGEIKPGGSTVRVSQINRTTADQKAVGSGHEFFNTTKLSTSYVDILADQVWSAAYEFDDLVDLQSQIGAQQSKIRQGMLEAIEIKLNNFLYSLVSPSAATPDHIINGVATFDAAQLISTRTLASQAKWMTEGGWWLLVDPSYYADLLNAQTLTSSDYVGDDRPVIGGQIATQRFGFNILEDNSPSMSQLSPTAQTAELALAFHPDFLHLVMGAPEFKISDLHSNKQFGYVMSVRMLGGAKLGISGNVKHIKIYNT